MKTAARLSSEHGISNQHVVAQLKLKGLSAVTAGALVSIQRVLAHETDPAAVLSTLAKSLRTALLARTAGGGSSVVDQLLVEDVVADATRNEEDTQLDAFSVVSAFDLPRYSYDAARKAYFCMGRHFPLHAAAAAKVAIFSERLALVAARLSRMPTFAPPIAGAVRRDHVPLTAVDALPTAPAGAEVYVLGVLTQPEEGLWCLEDGQKCVALNLAAAARAGGFFTEMAVVLVQGRYDADATSTDLVLVGAGAAAASSAGAGGEAGASGASGAGTRFVPLVEGRLPGVLTAAFIAHPPEESRRATLAAMALEDPLGHIKSPAEFARALALEKGEAVEDGEGGAGAGGAGGAVGGHGLGAAVGALQRTRSHGSRSAATVSRSASMGVDDAAAAGADADADADAAAAAALEDVLDLSEPHGSGSGRAFLVLSDVHLDRPATLDNLARLLRTYASSEQGSGGMPAVLVLMGGFSSTPFGQLEGDRDRFAARMEDLARLLASVPQLREAGTQVVLVPGPTDPGTSGALPRPALPAFFCRSLARNPALPAVHLTSNPCRVRWYTQELLLFRCDLTNKLQRRSILAPSPESEPSRHTLETVVKQGHLCPLPLSVQPLYWEHDHALRLCPLPDVLILGESRARYAHSHAESGMAMVNPGPFHKESDFVFYAPATRSALLCRVNEGEGEAEEDVADGGSGSGSGSGHMLASEPSTRASGAAASAADSAARSSATTAMRSPPASAARSPAAAVRHSHSHSSAGGGGSGSALGSAARSPGTAASAASPAARSSAARGMLAAEDDEDDYDAGLAAEEGETREAPGHEPASGSEGRGHMAADDAPAAEAADAL